MAIRWQWRGHSSREGKCEIFALGCRNSSPARARRRAQRASCPRRMRRCHGRTGLHARAPCDAPWHAIPGRGRGPGVSADGNARGFIAHQRRCTAAVRSWPSPHHRQAMPDRSGSAAGGSPRRNHLKRRPNGENSQVWRCAARAPGAGPGSAQRAGEPRNRGGAVPRKNVGSR